jgi:hypothetical protein
MYGKHVRNFDRLGGEVGHKKSAVGDFGLFLLPESKKRFGQQRTGYILWVPISKCLIQVHTRLGWEGPGKKGVFFFFFPWRNCRRVRERHGFKGVCNGEENGYVSQERIRLLDVDGLETTRGGRGLTGKQWRGGQE